MRKDMFKIIVERPRRGGKWGKEGRKANLDPSEQPKTESMRKSHRDRKSLNENLKPLERYFISQVGRPWDKVYSEVCEHLSSGSTVKEHVKNHVKDLVRLNVTIVDENKVFYRPRSYGRLMELYNNDLYVDPETKILCQYKSKTNRRMKSDWKNPEKILAGDLAKLGLVIEDGTLYRVHKSKKKSPKYDKEQIIKTKANAAHARQDFDLFPKDTIHAFLYKYQDDKFFQCPYFAVMTHLWWNYNEKKLQEKAALERKKALEAEDNAKAILAKQEDNKDMNH